MHSEPPKIPGAQKQAQQLWLVVDALDDGLYYGFILLVAFNKEFLSQKLGAGVMTVGIPLGFGVIVFTVVITAI